MGFTNYILRSNNNQSVMFSSDADYSMVIHTIKETKNRIDMIMKHDSYMIQHGLDYIAYHLRRFGYRVETKQNRINTHIIEQVPLIDISLLKRERGKELSNNQKCLYVESDI